MNYAELATVLASQSAAVACRDIVLISYTERVYTSRTIRVPPLNTQHPPFQKPRSSYTVDKLYM